MAQVVNITVQANAGINLANRSGGLGAIAPLDATATVASDIVRAYTNPDTAKTDHGDGSLLHVGAKAANANLARFFLGGFDDVAQPATAELTFGDSSAVNEGTLPAAVVPLYDITSASHDGTAFDSIFYTSQTPNASNFPNAGDGTGGDDLELFVNPETGEFYTSLATSGAGAGIVFTGVKSPDWTKIREVILGKAVRYVELAGWDFNPQYFAVYKDHASWCDSNDVVCVASLPDGVGGTLAAGESASDDLFPGDHQDGDTLGQLLTAVPSDALAVVAGHRNSGDSADWGIAHAAKWASLNDGGSPFYQPVAKGITPDPEEVFTASEYGAFTSPATDTLHEMGACAVIPSPGTGFIYSVPRTTNAYSTNDFNFNSLVTRVRLAGVKDRLKQGVISWISASPVNARFNDTSLLALRGNLQAKLQGAAQDNLIDAPQPGDVFVPTVADTDVSDRAVNNLDGVIAKVRIDNEVYVVNITLGVGF